MKKIILQYKNLNKEEKAIFTTTITSRFNFIWSIIKIIFGLFNMSYFIIASGVFTLFIGISKYICLSSIKEEFKLKQEIENNKEELTKKRNCSYFIILAGIFYILYMIRLAIGDNAISLHLIICITIALFSFTSLVLSIIGMIRFKNHGYYFKTIKVISLITALTDIVLTQMALLMVKMPVMDQKYNFYFGILIGLITITLGIINFISIKKESNKK